MVKIAQKWSLNRSTIQNELRNKCKTSNWRHIICTKVSILEWTIFRMRTVQHSQGEVNIIRICVMTEYRGGFDERRTLYYIFLLEVGRTKAYVHPSPDVATTSLAIFLRPAVCIFFWTQIGRPTGRGYAGEGWTHRGVKLLERQ